MALSTRRWDRLRRRSSSKLPGGLVPSFCGAWDAANNRCACGRMKGLFGRGIMLYGFGG